MATIGESAAASLEDAMAAAAVKPLWVHFKDLGSREPNRMERPIVWRWTDLQPVIDRASAEISMEDAERRVLICANPAFAPQIQTTGNLIGALQILNAGEAADEHRHTMAAIRMILEADGGVTSIDGQPFEMAHGDLILTPAWTWHAHENATSNRVIWFDGLDVPFVRASMDAAFLEPHAPANFTSAADDLAQRWQWVDRGLSDAAGVLPLVSHSPKMHYPWGATTAMLDRMQRSGGRNVTMRYVNPQTGGAIMPTLDCFMSRLEPGVETSRHRAMRNAVCVVIEGEGVSEIGGESISWAKNDVFTVPHWTWASHRARSERAHIFMMTDAEIFRRLALFREEDDKVA